MDDLSLSCNLNDLITRLDTSPIVQSDKPPKLLQTRYLIGGQLGQGSYGKVKLCVDICGRRRLAIKIVTIRLVKKISRGLENIDREADAMRKLEHKNVARLYADFYSADGAKRYLVMEWALCSIHDLQTRGLEPAAADALAGEQQSTCRRLPETQARCYFVQLLDGVEYLHSVRLVHKDLKPGNLLLTPLHQIKITDFGVCEWLGGSSNEDDDFISGSQATPAIQPPEVASGCKRFSGHKLDMYCCGLSLYFMVSGRVPYTGRSVLQIYEAIIAGRFVIPDWISEPCRRLVVDLMSHEPADRPAVTSVRQYDWLRALADGSTTPGPGPDWVQLDGHFDVESEAAAVDRLIRLRGDAEAEGAQQEDAKAKAAPASVNKDQQRPAETDRKKRRKCQLS